MQDFEQRTLSIGSPDVNLASRPAPGRGFRRNGKEDTILSHAEGAADGMADKHDRAADGAAKFSSEELLERILKSLTKYKAEETVRIDLRGKSTMADYMVVCSGRSSRRVTTISERLADDLKRDFGVPTKMEGKDRGDWVLIDAGDVIVHVFRPEVREFYQLEKMWLDPSTDRPRSGEP